MTILNEGVHAGEFLLSEANGDRSRNKTETMSSTAATSVPAGTVVGRITADSKLLPYADGNVDGSETAVGILWDSADATAADAPCAIIARDATVARQRIAGLDANGEADLNALGILVRDEYS